MRYLFTFGRLSLRAYRASTNDLSMMKIMETKPSMKIMNEYKVKIVGPEPFKKITAETSIDAANIYLRENPRQGAGFLLVETKDGKTKQFKFQGTEVFDLSTPSENKPKNVSVASAVAGLASKVIVTDIDIPFRSMVNFMVKWSLASIPAFIILFTIFGIIFAMFAGLIAGMSLGY